MTRLEAQERLKAGIWNWQQYSAYLRQFYPDKNSWTVKR